MITGNIDFATGKRNMEYVLFGENLPFRKYKPDFWPQTLLDSYIYIDSSKRQ